MRKDVRVIESAYDAKLCEVEYDEEGEIVSTLQVATFSSMAELYNFADLIYRATLKPVILRNTDGTFE